MYKTTNRHMTVDIAPIHNRHQLQQGIDVSCYMDPDPGASYRSDEIALCRLRNGEFFTLGEPVEGLHHDRPKTPKETVGYLADIYQIKSFSIIDSSGKTDLDGLRQFAEEYGLSDRPFVYGRSPDLPDREEVPVREYESTRTLNFPRRLPAPLAFERGRLSWFPLRAEDGRLHEASGHMMEEEDGIVRMKLSAGSEEFAYVAPENCWSSKKECRKWMAELEREHPKVIAYADTKEMLPDSMKDVPLYEVAPPDRFGNILVSDMPGPGGDCVCLNGERNFVYAEEKLDSLQDALNKLEGQEQALTQ